MINNNNMNEHDCTLAFTYLFVHLFIYNGMVSLHWPIEIRKYYLTPHPPTHTNTHRHITPLFDIWPGVMVKFPGLLDKEVL